MKDTNYVLCSATVCDLTEEKVTDLGIKTVCFNYVIDGVSYEDDFGKTTPPKQFYQLIRDGATPTTGYPSYQVYVDFFTEYLKEGKDIIYVTLSSGITGEYNGACAAAQDLEEQFPDRKITVIDSLCASSGLGLLLNEAAQKMKEGYDYDQLVKWIEDHKLNVHHEFFSTDLTAYKRGGRISNTSYTIGNLLNIVPTLNVDDKGKLIPRKKTKGKKGAIKRIISEMKRQAEGGTSYDGPCYICQSDSMQEAEELKEGVEKAFPNLKGKIEIFDIGAVIGSHTGPGTVALFYLGDKRVD